MNGKKKVWFKIISAFWIVLRYNLPNNDSNKIFVDYVPLAANLEDVLNITIYNCNLVLGLCPFYTTCRWWVCIHMHTCTYIPTDNLFPMLIVSLPWKVSFRKEKMINTRSSQKENIYMTTLLPYILDRRLIL